MGSVVVSVRVPKWVKEKLEKYGIDISSFIKKRLLEEIERIEREELGKDLDILKEKLKDRIDPYELAKIIDEERKGR